MKPATRRDSTMVQGHYGYYKLKQTFQKQSEERKRYAFGVFKCQWIFATFFHPLTVTYRCYFFTVVWFHPFHQSFLIRSDCRHNDSFGRELQILGSCRVHITRELVEYLLHSAQAAGGRCVYRRRRKLAKGKRMRVTWCKVAFDVCMYSLRVLRIKSSATKAGNVKRFTFAPLPHLGIVGQFQLLLRVPGLDL